VVSERVKTMDLALAILIFSATLMICTGGTLATWLLSNKPLVQIQILAIFPDSQSTRPSRAYVRVGVG
jgi:hypothetical protein